MKKCPKDRRLTESVDVLKPGVGGSMGISDLAELLAAYKCEGLNMILVNMVVSVLVLKVSLLGC
jgi:aspartyl/asparaginyl-tRNA synthetase